MAKKKDNYRNSNKNYSKGKNTGFKPKREQPRKDSDTKRINLDNARVGRVEKDIEKGSRDESRNAVSEISRNPEFLKAAASIPFASILGDTLTPNTGMAVPGVMTVTYNPCFGSEEFPLAWNKAYSQIYSYIVHANSRNYAQDAPDYALYIMAGSEIFAAIAEAIRAYGLMKSYTEPNYYYVSGLLQAAGWNADDLRKNLSSMWFDINDMIYNTKDIWIPDVLPIVSRHMNLNSFVYTDAPTAQAQSYIYVRDHYFMLSQVGSEQGTCLVPAVYYSGITPAGWKEWSRCEVISSSLTGNLILHSWEEFKSMVYNMIDRLLAAQDRGQIFGNIMNAYGTDRLFALRPIDASYEVKPTYNAEILMQIENLTTCEMVYPGVFAQEQGSGTLGAIRGPLLTQYWRGSNKESNRPEGAGVDYQVLNMHFAGQPTPEAIAEASRMKVGGLTWARGQLDVSTLNSETGIWDVNANFNDERKTWLPITCQSEIPRAIYVTQAVGATAGLSQLNRFKTFRVPQYSGGSPDPQKPGSASTQTLTAWTLLMPFDWHPFLYNILVRNGSVSPDTTKNSFVYANGDYDNYTMIEPMLMRKINTACLYSVLGIPQAGYNHKYLDN